MTERRIQTFHVTTFGCQMNLADSSTLVSSLVTRGFRRVRTPAEADLIILNTCSVREKAEQRVLGRLSDLSRLKKDRPWHRRLNLRGLRRDFGQCRLAHSSRPSSKARVSGDPGKRVRNCEP